MLADAAVLELSRRRYLHAGLLATVVSGSGCFAADDDEPGRLAVATDDAIGSVPVHELPAYAEWIPAESHDSSPAVYLTHVDWEAIDAMERDHEPDEEAVNLIREAPILGLPILGAFLSGLAVIAIMFYPFARDLYAKEDDDEVSGVEVHRMTWSDDVITFHGDFDPEVFDDRYADDFDEVDEREGFTVYAGSASETEAMAYAVSSDVLVVGMLPGEEDDDTEAIVTAAVDRYLDESDRIVDEDAGRWLFETTGDAQMSFGGWHVEELRDGIDSPADDEAGEAVPEMRADLEERTVFDDVEHLVNTLVFAVEDGAMTELEARFAGIYPEDAVPTEETIEDELIGAAEPSEIVIEDRRVYAAATFEEVPD